MIKIMRHHIRAMPITPLISKSAALGAGTGTPIGLPPWLEVVRQQVAGLRYGVVQIVVHEDRVVQIERTERVRFAAGFPTTLSGASENAAYQTTGSQTYKQA
jgi:hypothetical protein